MVSEADRAVFIDLLVVFLVPRRHDPLGLWNAVKPFMS